MDYAVEMGPGGTPPRPPLPPSDKTRTASCMTPSCEAPSRRHTPFQRRTPSTSAPGHRGVSSTGVTQRSPQKLLQELLPAAQPLAREGFQRTSGVPVSAPWPCPCPCPPACGVTQPTRECPRSLDGTLNGTEVYTVVDAAWQRTMTPHLRSSRSPSMPPGCRPP